MGFLWEKDKGISWLLNEVIKKMDIGKPKVYKSCHSDNLSLRCIPYKKGGKYQNMFQLHNHWQSHQNIRLLSEICLCLMDKFLLLLYLLIIMLYHYNYRNLTWATLATTTKLYYYENIELRELSWSGGCSSWLLRTWWTHNEQIISNTRWHLNLQNQHLAEHT